jgi:molybdate transport system substrate-binding protein
MIRSWEAFLGTALVVGLAGVSHAAEIKLLSPTAMRAVMPDITRPFEQSSGHKVTIDYATVGVLTERVSKGEAADAVIVSAAQIETLSTQGRIAAGSTREIARVGVGLFVRTGAAKLDVGSAEALIRVLRNAKSIGYGDPAAGGVSGVQFVALLARLKIAEEMKPKTRLAENSQLVLAAVAKGEIEIGIGLTSDIAIVSGIALAATPPAELQNYTLYAGGVVAGSQQAEAARALISVFATPQAHAAMRAKGFEPR